MGDTVELEVLPYQQSDYFYTNGYAISFEVKAPYSAVIGISSSPDTVPEYIIEIGRKNKMTIIGKGEIEIKFDTPNILSATEFRNFTLSWTFGRIKLEWGDRQTIEQKHITNFVQKCTYCDFDLFQYFKFINKAELTYFDKAVVWKFDVPPKRPNPIKPALPITHGELKWVFYDGVLPPDAVCGGFGNEAPYVARAIHRRSLTPGMFLPSEEAAYIPWGGEAHTKHTHFWILCGFNFQWVKTTRNNIPPNAIAGGYSEVNREPLYIGRAKYMDLVIPGKVQPSHNCCYFPYEESELASQTYEILTLMPGHSGFDENSVGPLGFVHEDAQI